MPANGKHRPADKNALSARPEAPTSEADPVEVPVEETSDDDVALDVSEEFKQAEHARKEAETRDDEQAEEFAIQQLLAEEDPAPPRAPASAPAPASESSRLRKAYAAAVEASTSVPVEEAPPAASKPGASKPTASKPTAPAPASKPALRPKLKKYDDDGELTLLQRWKKPIPIGVTIAVAFLVISLMVPLFRSSGRVRVFPAQGKAEYEGQPIANASIFLHPTWVKEPSFPRPRATVNDDGTFTVGTYAREDGAPPGEYKVTVQWFTKIDPADEDRLPVNLLPPRYAKAETSDVTIEIREGENQLPAIKLKY